MRRLLWPVFALSLGGCGGGSISSSSPPPPSGDAFQTSWHAAVTSQTNSEFTSFDVFIEQNGTALQSQEVLLNYMCGQQGMMAGSATANTLAMTITANNDTIVINGTLLNGDITGTYTTSGPCGGDNHGTLT